jgi:transglutaminase/protease-like cytokinesis protein 3
MAMLPHFFSLYLVSLPTIAPQLVSQLVSQQRFFVKFIALALIIPTLFVYSSSSLFCGNGSSADVNTPLREASANSAALHDVRANSFAAIDSHAERIPQHIALQPMQKFVAYLTKPATNDIEKARAVARWITSNIVYDFEAVSAGKHTVSDNPDSILVSRHAVDMGFANLFVKMMHSAGVEAFAISGVKKGVNFTPGSSSSLKRHAWNAFRTGGKWYLVDLPVYKEVETNDSYKLIYADAFFCIQPEQMIYTNFPDDRRWQLLNEPMTKEQFLTSVQCFGAFYGYNVRALTHPSYTIASKERSVTLSFDAPHSMNLGARVYAEKDAKEQRTIVKCTREGKKHIVIIKFLADGDYKLEITATEYIKDRAKNEVVGCSVKTVAEYNVLVGEKAGRSLASAKSNE